MDIDKELEKNARLKEKLDQLGDDIELAIDLGNILQKKIGENSNSTMFPLILYFLVNKIESFRNEVNFETPHTVISALPRDGKISPDNLRQILQDHFNLSNEIKISFFLDGGAQIDMENLQQNWKVK